MTMLAVFVLQRYGNETGGIWTVGFRVVSCGPRPRGRRWDME